MTILLEADPATAEAYRFAIGGEVVVVDSVPNVVRTLAERPLEQLVLVGASVDLSAALELAEHQRVQRPGVGVVLLRRRLDVHVLALALRAGIREVVNPEDMTALADACRRSLDVSRRLQGSAAEHRTQGRVTTVFSAKGGCGKTTMATNIAVLLAAGGRERVCLIDLDLAFGDVAIALQLMPGRTVVDAVAMAGSMDEQGVASLITPHSPGLDTLCAPLEPGEADRIPVTVVSELIQVLRGMYDHVVIDTPPAFTEHVLASFDVSDSFVLLATLDIPALKNLRLTLDMLSLLGYSRENWLIVLNRADSKVGLSVSDVEQSLKTPIAAQVPSSRAVSASINKGVPIVLEESNHPVSVAMRTLVEQRLRRASHSPSGRQEPPAGEVKRPRRMALLRRGGKN